MAIDYTVGNILIVSQTYVQITLSTINTTTAKNAASILGSLGTATLTVAATGTIGLTPYIRVVPPVGHSKYKNGSGVIVYFESDAQLNNSFELSNSFFCDYLAKKVLNSTGGTLTKGSVVYQVGFDIAEQLPTIALASAAVATTAFFLGILEEDIADGGSGSCLVGGAITADTSAMLLNDSVYLSDTPGGFNATSSPGTISLIVGQVSDVGTSGSFRINGQQLPAPGGSGSMGATGLQGETGIKGCTGIMGDTGIEGLTGLLGLTGLAGIPGTPGAPGSQGVTGLFGGTGIQGIQGITGAQGVQGITGLQGPAGQQGITGVLGIQGITGAQGLQGITGLQGIQGDTGVQGVQGITGLQGIQGITGLQGVAGDQGITGLQGIQGITGLQGIAGDQGITGLQGIQGLTGLQGIQGLTGLQGVAGDQGITGLQGVAGDQGITGLQGIQGLTGLQGVLGNTGFEGITGTQGLAGDQGITGVAGIGGGTTVSVLTTLTDLNFDAGATTINAYFVAGDTSTVVTNMVVRLIGAMGITTEPTISAGWSASTTNVFAPTETTGVTTTGELWTFTSSAAGAVGGMLGAGGSTGLLLVGVTGLVGDTGMYAIDVLGYEF
jgi:hypothetical protein